MAHEPDCNEDHRLTEILQKATPAPQTPAAKPFVGDFQFAKKGGKPVIGRRSIIKSNRTRKNLPLRRSLRPVLSVVAPIAPRLLSVQLAQPLKSTIIRTSGAIAVDRAPDIRPAAIFTSTGSLTVVPFDICFKMHAGCVFFHPRHESNTAMAADKRNDI